VNHTSRCGAAGAGAPPRDRRELASAPESTPTWSRRQQRFLEAYRQQPTISRAARSAGVRRSTVFLWLTDSRFAGVLDAVEKAALSRAPSDAVDPKRGNR
jgi:hypothetical protein